MFGNVFVALEAIDVNGAALRASSSLAGHDQGLSLNRSIR
jgi:hypothetical protein